MTQLKLALVTEIKNKIYSDENAACPVCQDTWAFDDYFVWDKLNKSEKKQLLENGFLLVICEDCQNKPSIDDIEDLFYENEIEYSL